MLIKVKTIEKAQENQKEYKEGIYKVRITKCNEGKSATTGTPYIDITFETIENEIFSVKKRFYNTEKAINMLLNVLSAIGIYDKNNKEDLNFNPDDLLGSILQVEFVKGEPNEQGKKYLEFNPYSAEAVSGLARPNKKLEDDTMIGEEEIPF